MKIIYRIGIIFIKASELGVKMLLIRWFGPDGAGYMLASFTATRSRVEVTRGAALRIVQKYLLFPAKRLWNAVFRGGRGHAVQKYFRSVYDNVHRILSHRLRRIASHSDR